MTSRSLTVTLMAFAMVFGHAAVCLRTIGLGSAEVHGQERQMGGVGLTIFADRNFRGRSATLREDSPDLRRLGFNDVAQSLHIARGEVWQVCADANYRNCLVVNSDWPDLRGLGMFRRISAVRPWPQGSGGGQFSIVLFDNRGFRGRSFRVDRDSGVLSGFANRAESVQVMGGSWQLCDGANFSGRCVWYRAACLTSRRSVCGIVSHRSVPSRRHADGNSVADGDC